VTGTRPAGNDSIMAKDSQQLRAGFLVHDVSRLRRTVFDQRVKPLGITRSQWWVLANLSRHEGEDMMQIELARLLDVGKVALGGLIDKLESNGLVARTPDKLDRRSKRVSVSAKGRAVLRRMNVIGVEMNSQIMRGISAREQRQLEEMLSIMKHNLIRMDAVPVSSANHDRHDTKKAHRSHLSAVPGSRGLRRSGAVRE
jgi:MarR family transcriptional regulator, transcriptional regulator for hemolysin